MDEVATNRRETTVSKDSEQVSIKLRPSSSASKALHLTLLNRLREGNEACSISEFGETQLSFMLQIWCFLWQSRDLIPTEFDEVTHSMKRCLIYSTLFGDFLPPLSGIYTLFCHFSVVKLSHTNQPPLRKLPLGILLATITYWICKNK